MIEGNLLKAIIAGTMATVLGGLILAHLLRETSIRNERSTQSPPPAAANKSRSHDDSNFGGPKRIILTKDHWSAPIVKPYFQRQPQCMKWWTKDRLADDLSVRVKKNINSPTWIDWEEFLKKHNYASDATFHAVMFKSKGAQWVDYKFSHPQECNPL